MGSRLRLAPSSNIGLICYECCSIAHAAIDRIHDEPALTTGELGRVDGTNVSLRVDHTKNEQTPYCWQNDDRFEPEEGSELIWSKCAEWKMDKPEQEEGKHAGRRYAD